LLRSLKSSGSLPAQDSATGASLPMSSLSH
jgi:hypothetical protein